MKGITRNILLLLFFLGSANSLTAQTALSVDRLVERGYFRVEASGLTLRTELPTPSATGAVNTGAELLPPPAAWRYEDLAFFCRVEVQLERKTRFPVRFRLGSTDYVNYLEGK